MLAKPGLLTLATYVLFSEHALGGNNAKEFLNDWMGERVLYTSVLLFHRIQHIVYKFKTKNDPVSLPPLS